MSREIKFRGIDKETNRMVFSDEIGLSEFFYLLEDGRIDPETVGQSTGLCDKNGKDLDWWEGDLFKMHGHLTPWEIVKAQGCFWFRCPITKERKLCYRVAEYFHQPEKIGNIHNSPELLEKL